ncbi:hypothetical protein BCR32DRAFT_324092 [Anaeromyces robustus]|uniref:Gamma-glutamylcyclotransferase AIG2-like domain-containing protein n=1 Tax=Anaeromyces robustus TaxID=1754192 RepID=A0A1Y1XRG0_9FUNG|nr:hypothetical protein BCR32DRAFT_324092 [Anaeromyces robustus]|eukprot:ORX88313.1 hypothetical protein BCR32DRAFT_324092 [Anaeromyces robustus]
MANQYSYHLSLQQHTIHHINDSIEHKNNSYYSNLNLLSNTLLANGTKNLISYYYDYIHKNFNFKNTAYYNQLTRSSNFLNNEVFNNFNLNLTSASFGNDSTITPFNTSALHFPPYHPDDYFSSSTTTTNNNGKSYHLLNNLWDYNRITAFIDNEEEENKKDKESKNTIKDLIDINNFKNEKIIENNLKKSFEKNLYGEPLKLKSISHNSLHLDSSTLHFNDTATQKEKEEKIENENEIETKNEDIQNFKNENIEDYASHPNYVFGYGSLINPDSRGSTVDSTKNARVIKVLAKGLERSWNYNCRDVYTAVGVSKVKDTSITCNGVIIPIDDPINDLPKLDERELHYRRVQLSRKDIIIIHDEKNQDVEDENLLASDAIIWVYEIVDTFTPTTSIPISQIYIDCILLGCIKEGGIEFAKQFIENTHGWNTSVWVNDRTSEHFRKNISRCLIKLNDEIISSIDSLLTNNLCIDVNKRIIPAY